MGTVVVVGAGVSGLQAARALLKKGLRVVVLEQIQDVGGVWSRNWTGYGIQVPYTCYQFGEFPWTRDMLDAKYPSAAAVRKYIHAYAQHFGLLHLIRFGCLLQRVASHGSGHWGITYLDKASGTQETLTADYVVISTGVYCTPNIPEYKGEEVFAGRRMHARDLKDASLANGQRVVVIGAGKTALDCAAEVVVSSRAAGVTWLFRQVHWPLPRQLDVRLSKDRAKRIPIDCALYSHLPKLLMPPYYTAGLLRKALWKLLRPGQALAWSRLEQSIEHQFNIRGIMLPAMPLREDMLYSGSIIDSSWHELIDPSAVKVKSKQRPSLLKRGWWSRDNSSSSNSKGLKGNATTAVASHNTRSSPTPAAAAAAAAALSSAHSSAHRSRRASATSPSLLQPPRSPRSHSRRVSAMTPGEALSSLEQPPASPRSRSRRASALGPSDLPRVPSWEAQHSPDSSRGRTGYADASTSPRSATSTTRSQDMQPRSLYRSNSSTGSTSPPQSPKGRTKESFRAAGSTMQAATSAEAVMLSGRMPLSPRDVKQPLAAAGGAVGEGVEAHPTAAATTPPGDDLPSYPSWADRRRQALRKRQEEQQPERVSLDAVALEAGSVAQEEGAWIKPVQGEVVQFVRDGVVLSNGKHLAADLVLYCTGYTKTYSYLDGAVQARLGLQKDGLYLYRSIIPPALPRLAFVGSEVSTLDNLLTAGLQAEWLAEHWAGDAALPAQPVMAEDVQRQIKWRRKLIPTQRSRSSVYNVYMNHYHAQLVADMGLTPPGFSLGKLMVPLTAVDYEAVFYRMPKALSSTVAEHSQKGSTATTSSRDTMPSPLQQERKASKLRPGLPVAAPNLLLGSANSNEAHGSSSSKAGAVRAVVSIRKG